MEENALVLLIGIIIVPIQAGSGAVGSQGQTRWAPAENPTKSRRGALPFASGECAMLKQGNLCIE